jgi:hypothetical protein
MPDEDADQTASGDGEQIDDGAEASHPGTLRILFTPTPVIREQA